MYVIKSLSLANYLLEHNFYIQKIDRSKSDHNRLVFLFNDTATLRAALGDYASNVKGNKNDNIQNNFNEMEQ